MPPRTPAIRYLQHHAGDGRIAGIGPSSLPPDWSTLYGLNDVRGYDSPQPSLRFAQLWAMMVEPSGEPARVSSLTPSGVKLFGMLGARYVVVDPGAASPFSSLAAAYQGRDATIFANRAALPRALVVGSVEAVGSEQSELEAVASPTFDPRAQAVVRQDELGRAPPPNGGSGDVRIIGEGNAHVTLKASLNRAGLVVLTDQYAPGWSVRVDGRPAKALQTNVVLRGVVVPAGTHRVEWRYSVPGLRLGAVLSGIGLLLALGWAAVLAGRARRISRRSVRRSVFCLFSVF
jgi:Bacterial membrane protein YfhO